VLEDAVERLRDSIEVERFDEQSRVLDLARTAPEEAAKLGLGWPALPLRLLLEGAKGREASAPFQNGLDARHSERADELALQIGLADVEAEALQGLAGEVRAEPGAFKRSRELALLPCVAEAGQADVASFDRPQDVAECLRAADGDDRDSLRFEGVSAPSRKRLDCNLVADSLDQHEGRGVGEDCHRGNDARAVRSTSLTQYYTATSLDGFIADENHSLEWLFTRQQDRSGPLNYADFIADVGAIAMGATTYEWIVEHELAGEDPSEWKWPYEMPSWVFTHRELRVAANADVRFVQGDVRPVHEEMARAAEGRNVWIVGGGDLAGQFADAGLLDEVIVYVAPVTLGAGAPLLPRRVELRTEEVSRNSDFVAARYSVVHP
jgi:dihydrofolate reductase